MLDGAGICPAWLPARLGFVKAQHKGYFKMAKANRTQARLPALPKTPTGITGLDEITEGGLPAGRPTLVCGGAGCGKTLLAMEFLVHGALEYGEPGVFVAFEENADELSANVASLGFDLKALARRKQVRVEYIQLDSDNVSENGAYNLEGLFIRLGRAIDQLGARRVVLDSLEALLSSLQNQAIVRSELRRLFRWLKDRGVTAIVTAERGEGSLTRSGLDEYVADCVILLDHRVVEPISTRRLRVIKYRGSVHGTNEYPFLIGRHGLSVLPITSLGLDHHVLTERVSSGVKGLDDMLAGGGFYRGSSILYSGMIGVGKSSLAAAMVEAACRRGERCLYFAFEESRDQIVRNMRSIGMDLQPHIDAGRLIFHIGRPTLFGLEQHLVSIYQAVENFKPSIAVLDPITDFNAVGTTAEVKATLIRLTDFLKLNQITVVLTSLTPSSSSALQPDLSISSLIDTWILLRHLKTSGGRRGLYIAKSRGMAHAQDTREYTLADSGITVGAESASAARRAAARARRRLAPPARPLAVPGDL
jgi:circadian clock protein KaiC